MVINVHIYTSYEYEIFTYKVLRKSEFV